MEIGSIIKNARNEAGLSQEKVSEALGVSRQTISNWETGKSFPDIVSVIKMSDLYSVSLDRLLKEESSMKHTYREYLEESTNTVRSNERKSKLILVFAALGIWALSVIAFFLMKDASDSAGYSLWVTWAILPILFFVSSYSIGVRGWFGKLKWLVPLVCGLMYSTSGTVTTMAGDGVFYRSVTWPDFAKLPLGLAISLAGLLIGVLVNKKNAAKQQRVSAD